MQIWCLRRGVLTDAAEQRRCVAVLWSNQVDAAAFVGAEAKVDGGSGVLALRRCEEEEEKRHERGKGKRPLALFIRRRDK